MQRRNSLGCVVAVATGVVVIYLAAVLFAPRAEWIFALYGLSLAAQVWMTIRILKAPYASEKSFEEYFYEDRPDLRCSGGE